MKKQELKELKNLKIEELEKRLSELRNKLLNIEMKIFAGEEKNVKLKKVFRRDIAQILSIIQEKKKEK